MTRLRRRSIRLKDYDYSEPGSYFVTICTQDKHCVLGNVERGSARLNRFGEIVKQCWNATVGSFANVELDEFVIMPNHFHGIISITDRDVGAPFMAPRIIGSPNKGAINRAPTLGDVVRSFKAMSCRLIRRSGMTDFSWQRNYYEHVTRNEDELFEIRRYIQENPLKWDLDPENPNRKEMVLA